MSTAIALALYLLLSWFRERKAKNERTANTTYFAVLNGALVNGANAGTLQVRFASETGGATAKIMAGSSIRLKKVA